MPQIKDWGTVLTSSTIVGTELIPMQSPGGGAGSSAVAAVSALADRINPKLPHIDLRDFTSVYAEPGEKVVFSPFTTSLDIDDASNALTQTQRRKNWRIFMEACLKANGGTGAHNGGGWYISANTSGGPYSRCGVVYIYGCLPMEPYNDSQYAPKFTLGGRYRWTIPGGTNLRGNSGALSSDDFIQGQCANTASRVVIYNTYFGWSGYGVPATTGAGNHLSGWSIDGISITVRDTGSNNNPGFMTEMGMYYDVPGATWRYVINDNYHIGTMTIDTPSTGTHVGAIFGSALNSYVDRLDIVCNQNQSFGLILRGHYYASGYDDGQGTVAGDLQAQLTTLFFNVLRVIDSGKGIAVADAALFANSINLEAFGNAESAGTCRHRLLLGQGTWQAQVGTFWVERTRKTNDDNYKGVIVSGHSRTELKTLGVLESHVTTTWTQTDPGQYTFEYIPTIEGTNLTEDGTEGTPVDTPEWVIYNRIGQFRLGAVRYSKIDKFWLVDPVSTQEGSEQSCKMDWNSEMTWAGRTGNDFKQIVTQWNPRPSQSANLTQSGYNLDRGRASNNRIAADVVTGTGTINLTQTTSFGKRFTSSGTSGYVTFVLPTGTAEDVGKRITFIRTNTAQVYFRAATGQSIENVQYASNAFSYITEYCVPVTLEFLGSPNAGVDSVPNWAIVEGREAVVVPRTQYYMTTAAAYKAYDVQVGAYSVAQTDSNRILSNRRFTVSDTLKLNLPAIDATTYGLKYHFWRDGPGGYEITPAAGQRIGYGSAAQTMRINQTGSVVIIQANQSDLWTVISGSEALTAVGGERYLFGSVTLSAGAASVSFATALPDANYVIFLSSDDTDVVYWYSKAASGFSIGSSNGSSTAHVDWIVRRL